MKSIQLNIRKVILLGMLVSTTNIQMTMAQEKITQTAGRVQLGEFAPEFAKVNDDVLFGEVWNRPGLSPHDRSMITIATLVGKGIIDSSLTHHLQFAKSNGVTRTEISELLTHVAFYAGWPNAWGAFRLAKDVWAEDVADDNGKAAFQREMIFPIGEPNTAYAQYFIGNSYLARVSGEQVPFSNVTFEPRCRNNWHIHHATKGGGQMLVCVAGRGWYQEEGKPAVEILPGTVINIPAGVSEGMVVNVPGKGNAGHHNGITGNIQVYIEEEPNDTFIRDDNDIIYNLLLDFPTAALGGSVDIPTIDGGKVRIKIEPGTQPGKALRLRGKGLPAVQGYGRGMGDMVVNISIYVPKTLNSQEKRALEEMRESDNFKGDNATKRTIFQKFKNYFN